MERNVVTLETAKRLKAAGFPQDKAHVFYDAVNGTWVGRTYSITKAKETTAAPTAQEIADQLPRNCCAGTTSSSTIAKCYAKQYEWNDAGSDVEVVATTMADTMAEALGLLWLKLNEGKQS